MRGYGLDSMIEGKIGFGSGVRVIKVLLEIGMTESRTEVSMNTTYICKVKIGAANGTILDGN